MVVLIQVFFVYRGANFAVPFLKKQLTLSPLEGKVQPPYKTQKLVLPIRSGTSFFDPSFDYFQNRKQRKTWGQKLTKRKQTGIETAKRNRNNYKKLLFTLWDLIYPRPPTSLFSFRKAKIILEIR